MLSDFLTLEVYFGGIDSAQKLEKAYQRYGREKLIHGVRSGDLVVSGSFCWLSEAGRRKAQQQLL